MKHEQVAVNRTCGSCSSCCTVMAVREEKFVKPAGKTCKHVKPGKGCAIYKTRPSSCEGFSCLWLRATEMPEWARPDTLGIMFLDDEELGHWSPFSRHAIMAYPVGDISAMWSEAAQGCYHTLWHSGYAVWFRLQGRARYLVDEKGREIPPHELYRYEAMLESI